MASKSGENDLDFSDIDSDDGDEKSPKTLVAHKNMGGFEEEEEKDESDNQNMESISLVGNEGNANETDKTEEGGFEPISPVSDNSSSEDKKDFETLSSNDSPFSRSKSNFENISDDEETDISGLNRAEGFMEEDKVGPIKTNEMNNESSNKSETKNPEEKSAETENSNEKDVINLDEDEQTMKLNDEGEDDVEAPVPSPFSDIGDVEDIGTGTDNELISDIMKESHEEFGIVNKENNNTDADVKDVEKKEDNIATNDTSAATEEKSETDSLEMEQSEGKVKAAAAETVSANVASVTSEVRTATEEGQEEGENKEGGENLIADIFGDSDDDEEEFEGFDDAEIDDDNAKEKSTIDEQEKSQGPAQEDDSSDDEMPDRQDRFESDFDKMMEEKKKQKSKRRSRKEDVDLVNDNDDLIAEMITKMKECAEEDRMLNQCGKAATKKLKMLKTIVTHLRKADLQLAFIDSGILPAIKEWLTPLPDHALPHVNIRKMFLKMLLEFPPIDRGALKVSGIGRAVMLLFKHPKEISDNKKMAGKIISIWARPIFNVSTNFQDISREEREDRDKRNLPEAKRRRLSSGADSSRNRLDDDDENRPRKPGDKGWIGRARVPMPSHRDYVNRPESKVDSFDTSRTAKRQLNRFEKQARKMKGPVKGNRKAVGVSLNGSRLSL